MITVVCVTINCIHVKVADCQVFYICHPVRCPSLALSTTQWVALLNATF